MNLKFAFVVLLVSWVALMPACGSTSPEAALEEFYVHKGAEDQNMDPLILVGESVVPLVMEKVKDRGMPRRRYAISFLGNGSYRQALPVLQAILSDESELDYFRGDALRAIYQIDEKVGTEHAQYYRNRDDHVGAMSGYILNGDDYVKRRRTYRQAWLGVHE